MLDDTKTTEGKFSVFEIDDEQTAEMIVAAIAADSKSPSSRGYLIVNGSIFSGMKIQLDNTPGKTGSDAANMKHYHVVVGSLEKRIALTRKLIKEAVPDFMTTPELKRSVKTFYQSGFINRISDGMRKGCKIETE